MNREKKIAILRDIIDSSDNIVFFGGAGVSTESNIPDFRSPNGVFAKLARKQGVSPEEMLSFTYFLNHPEDYFAYYKDSLIYKDAQPNNAHLALAKLEQMGKLKAVITQNVDGLHQKAGSKEVLELHGSIFRNHCLKCKKFFTLEYILESPGVPKCDRCGGIIKPDVIMYEESLDMDILNKAIRYIEKADVLIVGGTSLTVYPAAGLIRYYSGQKLVLINKTPTPYDKFANLVINDSIGETLKACVL